VTGLVLSGVTIRLAGSPLLGPIELTVAPGEVATLTGPSGSGKSTLLAFVAGFLAPPFAASGAVVMDGEDVTTVPPERRRAGLLFQDALLFPHLSVGGNLAFALDPAVVGREARRGAVEEALASAGLAGFADRDPGSLSGGQRTRVALMRSLLARPRMLLLDEPFSALDAPLRAEMRRFVFGHARERGLPTLLVTHDQEDAAAAGGRVIRLGDGP
jgi:putative thiamine transport system ATP-binding protein